ncbi:hypothetical protein K438DRAFT_1988102 [Mycena galopus ATCC 62051]|nr:hypothetical protein K438DRAFT_1988102 [Mycena galopus ATCC 62051]
MAFSAPHPESPMPPEVGTASLREAGGARDADVGTTDRVRGATQPSLAHALRVWLVGRVRMFLDSVLAREEVHQAMAEETSKLLSRTNPSASYGSLLVSKLASRQPSVPHSLQTRGQSKTTGLPTPLPSAEPSPIVPSVLLPTSPSASPPPAPPTHSSAPPSPTPPAYSDSDSSSDSSFTFTPTPYRTTMPGTAAILESTATKPPVLHEGETTQAVLRQFEIAFKNYVSYKSLDRAAQATILVGCFRDYRITDWLEIDSERDAALLMTFKEIMAKVRSLILSPSWERDLRVTMNQRKQGKTEPFSEFATAVRSTNSLLINTTSHEDYEDDPDAKKEKSFPLWLVEVERVDIKRSRANARLRTIADEQRKAADVAAAGKRNANSDSNDRPPKKTLLRPCNSYTIRLRPDFLRPPSGSSDPTLLPSGHVIRTPARVRLTRCCVRPWLLTHALGVFTQ